MEFSRYTPAPQAVAEDLMKRYQEKLAASRK
jgi:hypothetical protein